MLAGLDPALRWKSELLLLLFRALRANLAWVDLGTWPDEPATRSAMTEAVLMEGILFVSPKV